MDIGTSRTKAVALDANSSTLFKASISHHEATTQQGVHEHSAEINWWNEVVSIVRELASFDRAILSDVCGLFVSGLFPCFCCTDSQGTPLTPGFLYDDNRAHSLALSLSESLGTEFPGNALIPRLLWLRQFAPGIFSQARRVFSAHNFVVFKLTGRYCLDSHTAFLYGPGFKPASFSWNTHLFRDLGLHPSILLPEVLSPSELAGFVTVAAAAETGLPPGIPVLAGTGDLFASIVGSGVTSPDDLFVHYGSGGALMALTETLDTILSATSYPKGNDGIEWIAGLPRSGKRLDWFRDHFSHLAISLDPSAKMESAATFYYGARGPEPMNHLDPPSASFTNLSLSDRPADLYRAMHESFAFSFRYSLSSSPRHRLSSSQLFAGGGGCQSVEWCQIVTDILRREQLIYPDADTAIGGAIVCGDKVGLFSLADALLARKRAAILLRPQLDMSDYYNDRYRLYTGAL